MKETREILDNILRMEKSDYELLESSTESITSKPSGHKRPDRTNVLPSEADSLSHDEENIDNMETYESTQEIDFEADEIKECLEKKKKKRNYIEFRPDYEKC